MKAVGVIVEYNPFHNGHRYHLERAKEVTGADLIIAVMSGDFTQRGEIACINRFKRAEIALANEIDLIVELPIFYSSQSAEIFAKGAMEILGELEVEWVVFGSESGDIEGIEKIATMEECAEFKSYLESYLKKGFSYPTAYSESLINLGVTQKIKSNDILGIEYVKSEKKLKRRVKMVPIKRIGAGYHDLEGVGEIASATGIRKMIGEKDSVEHYLPEATVELIKHEKIALLEEYYPLIRYAILKDYDSLKTIQDIEIGLENRLYNCALENLDFKNFFQKLITKRYTIGRLQRILIHILTGLTVDITKETKENLPYINILGFSQKGQEYLKYFKKNRDSRVPILVGKKNINKYLNFNEHKLFYFNERASEIYKMVNHYEDMKIPIIK
ncbi:MAG: nucleotidyltransferase [Fusobacteriaceae bacterium]